MLDMAHVHNVQIYVENGMGTTPSRALGQKKRNRKTQPMRVRKP